MNSHDEFGQAESIIETLSKISESDPNRVLEVSKLDIRNDLEGLDLESIDLTGLVLHKAILPRCNFSLSYFTQCDFSEVEWDNCNLEGSIFEDCDFQNSTFRDTNFQGAIFEAADFRNSSFINCLFEETRFEKCNLDHTQGLPEFTESLSKSVSEESPIVLVVEDERETLAMHIQYLFRMNCKIDYATNFSNAMGKIAKTRYDLVICDALLPFDESEEEYQMFGEQVVQTLKCPYFIITTHGTANFEAKLRRDPNCANILSKNEFDEFKVGMRNLNVA